MLTLYDLIMKRSFLCLTLLGLKHITARLIALYFLYTYTFFFKFFTYSILYNYDFTLTSRPQKYIYFLIITFLTTLVMSV